MIKKCVILLFIQISLQCSTPTFYNNIIRVNTGTEMFISGCMSPETLNFDGNIKEIAISDENIFDLNEGAVQNISANEFAIYFHHTTIEIIRRDAFLNLPGLVRVDMGRNKIRRIFENSFKDLPSLKLVGLYDNEIVDFWPRSFNNLPMLEEVVLSGNYLDSFDQAWFHKTPKLRKIYLGGNIMCDIPTLAFVNLPSVEFLDFHANQIEYVDKDAFKGLVNLETLLLNDNNLKSLEFNLPSPSKLTLVNIDHNNLTYISDDMLERIRPTIKRFEMNGNPWTCACYDKLRSWGQNATITFKAVEAGKANVTCINPKTNPNECIQRGDDDFEHEFWTSFLNKNLIRKERLEECHV
ncbi:phospholipase A2 inhibitor-like [Photinus pyralis]|uniref:phospholipase A2 inhibitor-like n=1 Tax=Photinus pyralis TaxID=7054 RepID=UPI0012676B60|nr:phospholipase A2 inhibitor-like [Photinus pyralis]